jgi:hypothetical protein
MKLFSQELGAFMMWIVDGTFARHIMNTMGDRLAAFMMQIVDGRFPCRHHEYEEEPVRPTNRKHREE